MYRDLTVRKQTERTLRESEERYRSLVETAKDVVLTLSTDGTFTSLNPAFETLTDWLRTEWIGHPFAPLLHPADLSLAMEFFQRLLQGETLPLSKLRILCKSGASRSWQFTATPQFREGKVVGVLGIARDITERRQVEEMLRESEERFRAIFDRAAIGIALVDMQGRFAKTNPAMQRLLGFSEGELYGARFTDFTHPEDRDTDWGLFKELVENKREHYQREKRHIRKDGSLIWTRLTVSLIRRVDGEPLFAVGMVEDVTERKRAEMELERLRHQLELILNSVADGIHVLDLQGKTTFVNLSAARMIGYAVEELTSQPMHDLLHHSKPDGTLYPREECPISVTLKDGALHHETDEVFWCRDGTSFPVEYTSTSIREEGVIVGAVVTFRDISERRAIERLKDEFVSMVSHELRTPLTSIRGALGLLTSGLIGSLPEKGQRMLEIAVNNTDRLVRLINDILDIERMQSGKVTMQRQVCDAAALMTQATDEMRGMAEKAGVTLSVSPQTARLWADPDRIVQTLTNLLSNAIKFSPSGATVRLTLMCQKDQVVDWLRQQDRLRQVPLVVYSAKDLDDAERGRLRLGQTQFFTKGRITPEEFEQRVIGLLRQIIPAKEDATAEQRVRSDVSL